MFDSTVFEIIRGLTPSARGEYEITDVNNTYINRNEMSWNELEGWWTDAGTFDSLYEATKLVKTTGANKLDLNVSPYIMNQTFIDHTESENALITN